MWRGRHRRGERSEGGATAGEGMDMVRDGAGASAREAWWWIRVRGRR